MQLDEPARQREAEAGPFVLLRVIAADLAELLEYGRLVRRGDADAGVANGNHRLSIVEPRRYVDAAAVRRELDGVRQEIEQDLLELALVGHDVAELRIDLLRERDAVALRALAHECQRIRQCERDVEGRRLEIHAAGLDLRQVEDVVDQRKQMLAG